MSRLTALPIITARWSATHPWRAIGAWFAFVAQALAFATPNPTPAATQAD